MVPNSLGVGSYIAGPVLGSYRGPGLRFQKTCHVTHADEAALPERFGTSTCALCYSGPVGTRLRAVAYVMGSECRARQ